MHVLPKQLVHEDDYKSNLNIYLLHLKWSPFFTSTQTYYLCIPTSVSLTVTFSSEFGILQERYMPQSQATSIDIWVF